jgi:hypothetical protein
VHQLPKLHVGLALESARVSLKTGEDGEITVWRLSALSERARKAATERERLHMCVHNVRGGHMWREQHTFSSAVWQAQRARAEHLELHGFGLFLRYLLSLQPLPLVKGSADVASVLRARLLNVQRASFNEHCMRACVGGAHDLLNELCMKTHLELNCSNWKSRMRDL